MEIGNEDIIKHECIYENKIEKIDEKQDLIAIDIGIIKSYLVGNGREGLIKTVDRHNKYFYIAYGCLFVIGVLLGVKL